jgi:hypothetical protein
LTQHVTVATRDTLGPANATLLYEISQGTPFPMGTVSTLAQTTAGGRAGIMLAGTDDSTGKGLMFVWLRLDGTVLVRPTAGDAGGQPTLLPNSEILELSVLAESASGPHSFHVAWRERSGAPGKDVIYYDRLQCEPRP